MSHLPIGRIVERVMTSDVARRSSTRVERSCVALLGLMFLPAGLQAAFFPQSFFDDFPLGRGWIAATEAVYSEHLVRDVGALFLALVIVSLWAWWEPALCLPVAVAWLVQGTLHFVYHAGHLDHFDGTDAFGIMLTLVLAPVLAIVAIVASVQRRRAEAGSST
jgi:hypothetical protein